MKYLIKHQTYNLQSPQPDRKGVTRLASVSESDDSRPSSPVKQPDRTTTPIGIPKPLKKTSEGNTPPHGIASSTSPHPAVIAQPSPPPPQVSHGISIVTVTDNTPPSVDPNVPAKRSSIVHVQMAPVHTSPVVITTQTKTTEGFNIGHTTPATDHVTSPQHDNHTQAVDVSHANDAHKVHAHAMRQSYHDAVVPEETLLDIVGPIDERDDEKEGGKEADASSTRVETMQSTVFVDDDVISDVMV